MIRFRCRAAKIYTNADGSRTVVAVDEGEFKTLVKGRKFTDCNLDVDSDGNYVCYEEHCIGSCSLIEEQMTDADGKAFTLASCSCDA